MNLMDIFRQNIKYYRFEKNFSQEELAELSDLCTHYISDIERGLYSPSIPTIEKISKALEIQPQMLFIENPEAKNLSAKVNIERKKKRLNS